jgi:hypothetical protein
MTKMLLILTTVAVAVASAASKTYQVSITSPAWIGTNELKPGEYKLVIEGDHALLRKGKTTLNVPAKIEAGNQKHSATAVTVDNQGNKPVLREIEVGGTSTNVVFPVDTNPTQ